MCHVVSLSFPAWGAWGKWGPCSATCSGVQQRSRTCENGIRGCPGSGVQSRPCNQHTLCAGNLEWNKLLHCKTRRYLVLNKVIIQ